MSRTNRSHWMREQMRDGVKRTKVKRKKIIVEFEQDEYPEYIGYGDEGEGMWTCCSCGKDVPIMVFECEECK